MKTWWAVALAIIGSFLAAGLLFLTVQQPRGQPVKLRPPPTASPIQVHVAGAVMLPGVYSLPVGSRVSDAVQAAGGLAADADPDGTNLAAILADGEKLYVPPIQYAAQTGSAPQTAKTTLLGDRIDINAASQAELESLPGIGEKIAQAIIAYRAAHGRFTTIQEIQDVEGIGPSIFEQIQPLITVGGIP
jgi:competence protein ComEA